MVEVASNSIALADSDYTSDSESNPTVERNEELTLTIRKQLAPALRDLMQHGLMPVGY